MPPLLLYASSYHDLELIAPRLLQNREVHIDYLRNTQEQANILREIVEKAKAKQPLDSELDFSCKFTVKTHEQCQEILGLKCSTSNCGSKPPGNKKNDRISQTPSKNKKNKVEAQPRKVNKVNHVVKPVCDVDVKHSLSKANSEILCATCNKSMFDGVHDKCLLDLVQNGNKRTKSAKKHKQQNVWKPTGCPDCTRKIEYGMKMMASRIKLCTRTKQKWRARIKLNIINLGENGVVERQNRTLVEAARTMLIFSKALLFHWAKAINTACYTQNRSLIRLRYNKTPYKLMQDKKSNLSFFHVFGSLCYPTNDHEDLGKFDAKADIGIFIGMTPVTSCIRLGSNPVSQQPCMPPIRDDWDQLFQPMLDEYFNPPPIAVSPVQEAAAPRADVLADSPVSTSIDQDAPSTSIPSSQEHEQSPIISQGFE
ncbi:retrovirus-related pol polyprotein from transposon TNT 1-94 [Tanacetum coccineum]